MKITKVSNRNNIVVIGGGTGSFTILNSLKYQTSKITALVNMVDDGGSTGELRDELGVLPPGDVRQCLVALSKSEKLRDVFNHRFPGGGKLQGHSLGNILISGIEEMYDFGEAVAIASEILNIVGQVMPVTLDNCRLVLKTLDGRIIRGEHKVDVSNIPSLKGAYIGFDKPVSLNPKAHKVIESAKLVVIAPGDLYTSIGPALAVEGMTKALTKTKAKIVYVCNLVNKETHTLGFSVEDYVSELIRIIGAPVIGYVLYNVEPPSDELLKIYKSHKEFPVSYDLNALANQSYQAIPGYFLSRGIIKYQQNDSIKNRSLIRHNGPAISQTLMRLL